jgi:hypothetical protein
MGGMDPAAMMQMMGGGGEFSTRFECILTSFPLVSSVVVAGLPSGVNPQMAMQMMQNPMMQQMMQV